MKLIDSNIIIYSALDDYRYLRPILKSPDSYASYISYVEVLGYHQLTENERRYFNSVFSVLKLLPVSEIVLNKALLLRQQQKLKLGDSIIAATALSFDLELYTRNVTDFDWIEGIKCHNPIDSR